MLSEDDAVENAQRTLRFEIGTMPHLSEPRYSDETDTYIFQIRLSYPRLPDSDDPDDDIEFDAPEAIGELSIDATTGDATHTPLDILEARTRDIKTRSPHARRTRE